MFYRGKLLKIVINTDMYESETSWSLNTCDGVTVLAGGIENVETCVPYDSYTFNW